MGLGFKVLQHALKRTVTEVGSVVKLVVCENCKGEYVYQLTREGSGKWMSLNQDTAYDEAGKQARRELQWRLNDDCDPVPCIFCGWYQKDMVVKLRGEHQKWMAAAAGFFIVIGFLAFLFALAVTYISAGSMDNGVAPVSWGVTVFCVIAAAMLIYARGRRLKHFDPNAEDVEKRKELGRYRAMSKADFIEMEQAEQGRDQ